MEKPPAENSVDQTYREDSDGLAYSYEHVDGLDVPTVTWWKDPGLRKLYVMMPVLFLGSTINGYDGSLLNGLQTMVPWQTCK
jgi:MFS family permease